MVKVLLCFLGKIFAVLILLGWVSSICLANITEPLTRFNFASKKALNPNAPWGSFAKNNASPPSYSKHYIAPAPWQYWSKANEIVITSDNGTVSGTINKSNGTKVIDFTCTEGTPFVYRFVGEPKSAPMYPLNTVLSGAGLIVEATGSISVNLRNVASDALGLGGDDYIKGNASLFSFGDAAIGTSFRVGYYRDDVLATALGVQHFPTYSIMALEKNTIVKIAGVAVATLNAGESYLFHAPMGTLVESSASAVMNTSADLDTPLACGDGAYNPIPPIASLGQEYVIVRGEGNLIAEQSTVIATEANTRVEVTNFDANGNFKNTLTFTLAQPGEFKTFNHGFLTLPYDVNTNTGRYSSSRIVADKNVEVFSGTASISSGGGCEVDVATLVPISNCSGSKKVETYKFVAYNNGDLPYFGYILTKSTDKIYLTTSNGSPSHNNEDIETLSGGQRRQLGATGLSLISFTDVNIGKPRFITITSNSRLTVSMVQQGGGFSMSNFISRFPEKATQPILSQTDCTKAILTAAEDAAPYQWYLNGVAISGAKDQIYTATASGNYTVTMKLECDISAPSVPINISLCNIDRSIKKTVDIAYPELNSQVVFSLLAENLGNGNAIGVSVSDKLPNGYVYVSSVPSTGTSYDDVSGIWTIGDLAGGAAANLKITAKVVLNGVNTNTATITGSQPDHVTVNDQSSVSTTTGSGDRVVCVNTQMVPIVYDIPAATTNVQVIGLPAGVGAHYNPSDKKLTISGTPTVPAAETPYTVSSTAGASFTVTGKITINNNVTVPVFNTGLVQRCIGAGSNSYVATASNTSGIVYSIAPLQAGVIDPATGLVTWSSTFSGTATITATAVGCAEQKTDFTVTVSAAPGLTLGAHPELCTGAASSSLSYTDAVNQPVSYSISWNNPSFDPITDQVLPADAIPFTIPVNAAVGTYGGTLTIKNASGCSTAIPFHINVKPKPEAPHVVLTTNSEY